MNLTVESDAEITAEAVDVLMKHLPPAKFVRALAALKIGKGDYVATREKLFEGESVDSLFKKMKAVAGDENLP